MGFCQGEEIVTIDKEQTWPKYTRVYFSVPERQTTIKKFQMKKTTLPKN